VSKRPGNRHGSPSEVPAVLREVFPEVTPEDLLEVMTGEALVDEPELQVALERTRPYWPPGPCWCCGGEDFRIGIAGQPVCRRCHPPVTKPEAKEKLMSTTQPEQRPCPACGEPLDGRWLVVDDPDAGARVHAHCLGILEDQDEED
jgi:hypothetical protein